MDKGTRTSNLFDAREHALYIMNIHIKKIYNNNQKKNEIISSGGFTLVEVLIATAIFAIAITGIITVATQGGLNTASAKNRLIANYLAQEGIEIVRAKRDSYVLSDSTSYENGWNNFIASLSSACTGPCDIDVRSLRNLGPQGSLSFAPCISNGAGASTCTFYYNSDGFYVHENGTTIDGTITPFTRELTFAPYHSGTSTTELEVTSNVTWKEGQTTQLLSMNESLFDYYASQ